MRSLFALAVAAVLANAPAHAADAQRPDGTFVGTLMNLHLVLHVKTADDGTLGVIMDSPDQGATGIAADHAELSGDTLKATFPQIQGAYVARFIGGRDSLDGLWSQGMGALPLRLHRDEKGYVPPRPQTPQPPYPYAADTVRFSGGANGVTLAGTFTHPQGNGPWPAVLLVTGSGPQNRDEELFGHKPFAVIADRLSRNGFAVLRMDDRGTAASSGDYAEATTRDFAADAAAGIAWLRGRKGVDPKRVGIVGHSEGGLIGPMVAARDPKLAFLLLLAGMGVRGDSLLISQADAIIRAQGGTDQNVADNTRLQRSMFEVMRSKRPDAEVREQLVHVITENYASRPAGMRPDSATIARIAEQQAANSAKPWLRQLLDLDPAEFLAQVHCPVLALNGTKDLQVLPDVNLPAIEAALTKAGNKDVTLRRLEGLNHLFQHAANGTMVEYAQISETFAPEALDAMTTWLKAKAGVK